MRLTNDEARLVISALTDAIDHAERFDMNADRLLFDSQRIKLDRMRKLRARLSGSLGRFAQ